MAIHTKEISLLGQSYSEICQAYFSAIASFDNVTAEGAHPSSSTTYEYFTITDGNYTFRILLSGNTTNQVLNVGVCSSSSSGGSSVAYFNVNRGSYSKTKSAIWTNGAIYSHARLFYDEDNNFIAASGLYAENYTAPYWFGIFHYNNKPLWFDSYGMDFYDMTLSTPAHHSYLILGDTNLDRNHDTPDSVYMERYLIEYTDMQTYMSVYDFVAEELFAIYNNAFYTNTSTVVNGFMFIATEDGDYMMLRCSGGNVWLKIDDVGAREVIIYNG